jgi:hypothetical protein
VEGRNNIMMQVQIPLSSPDIIEKDIEAIVGVMNSRFLSIGPKVLEFEKKMWLLLLFLVLLPPVIAYYLKELSLYL